MLWTRCCAPDCCADAVDTLERAGLLRVCCGHVGARRPLHSHSCRGDAVACRGDLRQGRLGPNSFLRPGLVPNRTVGTGNWNYLSSCKITNCRRTEEILEPAPAGASSSRAAPKPKKPAQKTDDPYVQKAALGTDIVLSPRSDAECDESYS